MTQPTNGANRRDFLKSTAAVGATAMAANLSMLSNVHAGGNNETIRVGLVGCGGRGTGAIQQNLLADNSIRLVAMGDAFSDRLEDSLRRISQNRQIRDRIDVPAERRFTGLNAYQRVLENVDLVVLATPPGFRPIHIEAAVNARKHIFTEKPVAVDGPGIQQVMRAYELANQRNLSVVAGTQRRYQTGYLESMRRIHDGAIGEITSARCYWNQGGLWHREKTAEMSDVEWQIRNWLYFTWLSGDHIVEQHVHNIDVVNWALQNSHPVRAIGMGGRQVRTAQHYGQIFDHFSIDFEYPNGVHVLSMARQIPGCQRRVAEGIAGTRGSWSSEAPAYYEITGQNAWRFNRRARGDHPGDNEPYRQEHIELVRSIKGQRQRLNDLRNVATSTMTAIMGRMAAYTGQVVTWEQAMNSQERLMPNNLAMDMRLAVPPVAVPGVTELR